MNRNVHTRNEDRCRVFSWFWSPRYPQPPSHHCDIHRCFIDKWCTRWSIWAREYEIEANIKGGDAVKPTCCLDARISLSEWHHFSTPTRRTIDGDHRMVQAWYNREEGNLSPADIRWSRLVEKQSSTCGTFRILNPHWGVKSTLLLNYVPTNSIPNSNATMSLRHSYC